MKNTNNSLEITNFKKAYYDSLLFLRKLLVDKNYDLIHKLIENKDKRYNISYHWNFYEEAVKKGTEREFTKRETKRNQVLLWEINYLLTLRDLEIEEFKKEQLEKIQIEKQKDSEKVINGTVYNFV